MDTSLTSSPWTTPAVVVLGLILGSFANVCIHRLPRGQSVVGGRSKCPACQALVAWYDNIPLVSYLLLRARCRKCGARISVRYPLVEAGAVLVSYAVYRRFGLSWEYLTYFLYAVSLLAASVIDLDHRIIPDEISLGGLLAGLALALLTPWLRLADPLVSRLAQPLAETLFGHGGWPVHSPGGPGGAWFPAAASPYLYAACAALLRMGDSLAGGVVGGGFLLVVGTFYEKVRRQEGLGGGDVKLLAMVGVFTGWQGALFTIFCGSLVASVVGVWLMIRRRSGSQFPIPFGPFLSLASFLYLLWGTDLVQAYVNLFRP